MPRPTTSFTHLDGIRVQYDRLPASNYGVAGINYRFYCDPDMLSDLNAFVADLRATTEPLFGPMLRLFSAGTYVDKPGAHGRGRAFDLDAVIWAGARIVANEQPQKTALYLLIQAIAHSRFGIVLGYNYNTLHRDHFHLDNTRSPQFRETKSTTYFIQEALNLFFSANLAVDGDFGNLTEGALKDVFGDLGLNFPPSASDWKKFLGVVVEEAVAFLELERAADDAETGIAFFDDAGGSMPADGDPVDVCEFTDDGGAVVASRAEIGKLDTGYAPEPGWRLENRVSDKSRWYLTRSGVAETYLGYDFPFGNTAYRGLARTGRVSDSLFYDHADYEAEHGLWAAFMVPTARCESEANFMVVNAWDSAAMTLGFLQMAAHTGEHLADLFRDLIEALPGEAETYFPELKLGAQLGLGGNQVRRLFATRGSDWLDLDVPERHPDGLGFRSYDRGRFMSFFNPHRGRLDLEEVAAAARWIAWMQRSDRARAVIVRNAVDLAKRAVKRVHDLVLDANLTRLPNGLHGVDMAVVQAAMDVKHHGRRNRDQGMSTNETILHALSKSDPLRSFRYVDTGWREDRSKRNVQEIRKMKPVFDGKTYDAQNETFS